jgi:hypothetical protein
LEEDLVKRGDSFKKLKEDLDLEKHFIVTEISTVLEPWFYTDYEIIL